MASTSREVEPTGGVPASYLPPVPHDDRPLMGVGCRHCRYEAISSPRHGFSINLGTLGVVAKSESWRVLYRTEPPRRISRDLLIRALAYRIQEKALGGIKPSTRRLLAKAARDASAQRPIQVAPRPTLKRGTVLLREWHGTQHQVIVREDGIVFQGKSYKSLSEVAYRITGTCVWRVADSGTKRWRSAGLRIGRRALNSGATWGTCARPNRQPAGPADARAREVIRAVPLRAPRPAARSCHSRSRGPARLAGDVRTAPCARMPP